MSVTLLASMSAMLVITMVLLLVSMAGLLIAVVVVTPSFRLSKLQVIVCRVAVFAGSHSSQRD